jgi:uncharacterized damage-inducible protein DinB
MTPKQKSTTITDILIERWQNAGAKLAELAEDIPETHYEVPPVGGVRTVGDILRHVAFWNLYVADVARGNGADGSPNELPKAGYDTKAKVIAAVRRSVAEAAAALRESSMAPDTVELIVTFLEHGSEHYGQLVVYARLNGIVPPASRGEEK